MARGLCGNIMCIDMVLNRETSIDTSVNNAFVATTDSSKIVKA